MDVHYISSIFEVTIHTFLILQKQALDFFLTLNEVSQMLTNFSLSIPLWWSWLCFKVTGVSDINCKFKPNCLAYIKIILWVSGVCLREIIESFLPPVLHFSASCLSTVALVSLTLWFCAHYFVCNQVNCWRLAMVSSTDKGSCGLLVLFVFRFCMITLI